MHAPQTLSSATPLFPSLAYAGPSYWTNYISLYLVTAGSVSLLGYFCPMLDTWEFDIMLFGYWLGHYETNPKRQNNTSYYSLIMRPSIPGAEYAFPGWT